MDEEIIPNQKGRLQVRAVRKNGWTAAKRAAFLAELAQSCNVSRANKAAGVATRSAYLLRARDPEFARQWQAALEIGYERLEMALVRRALQVVEGIDLDEGAEPVEKMTVEQAMNLLNLHRRSVQQGHASKRRQPERHVATQEETDAALIKRIGMVLRQRAARGALPPPSSSSSSPPPPKDGAGPDAPEPVCG